MGLKCQADNGIEDVCVLDFVRAVRPPYIPFLRYISKLLVSQRRGKNLGETSKTFLANELSLPLIILPMMSLMISLVMSFGDAIGNVIGDIISNVILCH